jgi:hypothetical protein
MLRSCTAGKANPRKRPAHLVARNDVRRSVAFRVPHVQASAAGAVVTAGVKWQKQNRPVTLARARALSSLSGDASRARVRAHLGYGNMSSA